MVTEPKSNNIEIKQVLMNGDTPRFVEYYSHVDGKEIIMNAERFCDVYGFSMSSLDTFNERSNKERI